MMNDELNERMNVMNGLCYPMHMIHCSALLLQYDNTMFFGMF